MGEKKSQGSAVTQLLAWSDLGLLLRVLVTGGALVVLTGAAISMKPLALVGFVSALFVGMGLLLRPIAGIAAVMCLRILFDLLWWVDVSVVGLNAMEVFSAGAVLGTAALVVLYFERVQQNVVLLPIITLIGALTLGWTRAGITSALANYLKLTSPIFILLLIPVFFRTTRTAWRLLIAFALTGAVPVLYSLYSVATHRNFEVYVGVDRLVGAYNNATAHGLSMVAIAAVAFALTLRIKQDERLRFSLPLVAGALVAIHFSYTRAVQIGIGLFALIFLSLEKQRQAVIGLLVAGALLFASSDILQERFIWTPLAALRGEALADTASELGTGRWGMWKTSLAYYFSQPPDDIVLGLGLGHQYIQPLGVDPHNDYISVMMQAGPMALISYILILMGVVREGLFAARNLTDPLAQTIAHFAVAFTLQAALVNGLTNGFLVRTSPAWFLSMAMGVALGMGALAREQANAHSSPPGAGAGSED